MYTLRKPTSRCMIIDEKITEYSLDSSAKQGHNEENSHYVLHPVNSFHLLERSVFIEKWVSEIKQIIPIKIDWLLWFELSL